MFSPDMPPLVDAPSFIPPPHGATNGGQPGIFDAFPGARGGESSTSPWAPQGTPYPTYQPQLPNWPTSAAGPPHSAQNWTYGNYQPAGTTGWGPPSGAAWGQAQATSWGQTPATSWGAQTPGGTWGAPSPASYGAPHTPAGYSPWAPQQQQQYFVANPLGTPFESSTSQPITAGWFGGGNGEGAYTPQRKPARASSTRQRSNSQGAYSRPPALQRSASWGNVGNAALAGYAPASYPGYAQGDLFDERNLARRPRDWRPDYTPRPGFASYIPRVGRSRSDVTEYADPQRRNLHPLLLYQPSQPPIYHNLCEVPFQPEDVEFLNLYRSNNEIDFAQLAVQPTCAFLRLYHARLPWYIDIHQVHPNGVTVLDVFSQIHAQLHTPIFGRHFWNEELTDSDRSMITQAFQERCKADRSLIPRGVVQLDFLGKKVVFEGLVRGPKGLWEIKTGKPQP